MAHVERLTAKREEARASRNTGRTLIAADNGHGRDRGLLVYIPRVLATRVSTRGWCPGGDEAGGSRTEREGAYCSGVILLDRGFRFLPRARARTLLAKQTCPRVHAFARVEPRPAFGVFIL